MKTLNTYTLNELKRLAHVNFHRAAHLLEEAGIKPVLQRKFGKRMATYYAQDAYDFMAKLNAAKEAKKAEKKARSEAYAARCAAAAERRALKAAKKEVAPVQRELPLEPVKMEKKSEPSLRELVTETNRLLQEMLDFWKK